MLTSLNKLVRDKHYRFTKCNQYFQQTGGSFIISKIFRFDHSFQEIKFKKFGKFGKNLRKLFSNFRHLFETFFGSAQKLNDF